MVRSVEKITLESIGPVAKVRIMTIQAQAGAKKRIADIGLSPGTKVGKIGPVPFNGCIRVGEEDTIFLYEIVTLVRSKQKMGGAANDIMHIT